MTKLSQKIIWDDDGNVVLASAYGQYAAGLLGAGMSSPDEEASLVQSYRDILKDIINWQYML
jgi:POT family proton-dependent oligopeptide transporter